MGSAPTSASIIRATGNAGGFIRVRFLPNRHNGADLGVLSDGQVNKYF